MNRYLISGAAAALLLATSSAMADCADELAQLTQGVSKDGSLAPLQRSTDATPQTGDASGGEEVATGEGEVAKTGDTEPLQADPSLATSGQDAQAQSAGGATAAAQAAGAEGNDKADALARAQAALDSGDEAACMRAVDEAKG
jgi:hypothetical protein